MSSLPLNLIPDSDIDTPMHAFPNKSTDDSSINSTPPVIAEHPAVLPSIVRKRGRPRSNFLSAKKINPRAKRGYLSDSIAFSSSRKLNFRAQHVVPDTPATSEENTFTVRTPSKVVRRRRRKSLTNTFANLTPVNDIHSSAPHIRNNVKFSENRGANPKNYNVNYGMPGFEDDSFLKNRLNSRFEMHINSSCPHSSALSNVGVNMKHSGCSLPHSISLPTNEYITQNDQIPTMNQRTGVNHNISRLGSNTDDSLSQPQCGSFGFEENLIRRLLPQTEAAISAGRAAGLSGPHTWTTDMVAAFIATLPGCNHLAEAFSENEIDGPALLCMDQFDLLSSLRLKLGPTVKVLGAIRTFRRTMMSIPHADLAEDHAAAFTSMCSHFTPAIDTINNTTNRRKHSATSFRSSNGSMGHSVSNYDSNLSAIQAHADSAFQLVNGA